MAELRRAVWQTLVEERNIISFTRRVSGRTGGGRERKGAPGKEEERKVNAEGKVMRKTNEGHGKE